MLEFARSANSERRKNGMDARQDVGVSISWGFASQNPKPKSGMDAAFGQRKG
jgi:hypothetical protein